MWRNVWRRWLEHESRRCRPCAARWASRAIGQLPAPGTASTCCRSSPRSTSPPAPCTPIPSRAAPGCTATPGRARPGGSSVPSPTTCGGWAVVTPRTRIPGWWSSSTRPPGTPGSRCSRRWPSTPVGAEALAQLRPAAQRDRALRDVAAAARHPQPLVRHLGRSQALHPHQPRLLPDGAPAHQNPDC